MRLRTGGLGLVVALAVVGIKARAEPSKAGAPSATEEDRAVARALADRGYELYQAGRYEEAKRHFHQANQRYQAPTLLLMMARCHEHQGQLRQAFEFYRLLVLEELPPNAPAPFIEARAQASESLLAIQKQMPAVKVVILGQHRKDAWIMIDDIAVESGELVPVDAGRHTITADVRGLPTARTQVELPGTVTKVVEITLGMTPKFVTHVEGAMLAGNGAPAAVNPAAAKPVVSPKGKIPRPNRPIALPPAAVSTRFDSMRASEGKPFSPSPIVLGVGIGVTVALTGTAAVLTGLGVAKGETADALCPSSCRDIAMQQAWRDAEAARVGLLNTSTWLFIGAGTAGLATAAYGLVWPRYANPASARLALNVAALGTSVAVTGRW